MNVDLTSSDTNTMILLTSVSDNGLAGTLILMDIGGGAGTVHFAIVNGGNYPGPPIHPLNSVTIPFTDSGFAGVNLHHVSSINMRLDGAFGADTSPRWWLPRCPVPTAATRRSGTICR